MKIICCVKLRVFFFSNKTTRSFFPTVVYKILPRPENLRIEFPFSIVLTNQYRKDFFP